MSILQNGIGNFHKINRLCHKPISVWFGMKNRTFGTADGHVTTWLYCEWWSVVLCRWCRPEGKDYSLHRLIL